MSFDPNHIPWHKVFQGSQSLWNRAMSFDFISTVMTLLYFLSQSLWNMAMSFDEWRRATIYFKNGLNPFGTGQCLSTEAEGEEYLAYIVSIPLEQGNVFRRIVAANDSLINEVSIPLEQGNVFRHDGEVFLHIDAACLNPFGTGQCLSTKSGNRERCGRFRLNPFGTGQCLSTITHPTKDASYLCLNPFGTGQCLST